MRQIDADAAIESLTEYGNGRAVYIGVEEAVRRIEQLPSAQPEPEAISKWKKEFREYVDSLDITRDDWKGIIEYIEELPSVQPDTTTHESIHAETGGNGEDRTSGDCISRTQAIEDIGDGVYTGSKIRRWLKSLPSAVQPDVIRCKDCVNYIDHRCVVADHHVALFSCCQDVFNARRRGEHG